MKMATALIQCMIRTGNGCTRARPRVVDLTAAVVITDHQLRHFRRVLAPREAASGPIPLSHCWVAMDLALLGTRGQSLSLPKSYCASRAIGNAGWLEIAIRGHRDDLCRSYRRRGAYYGHSSQHTSRMAQDAEQSNAESHRSRALAATARSKKITTVCDDTFASPWIQRPLENGFDFVMHSTTKYIKRPPRFQKGTAARCSKHPTATCCIRRAAACPAVYQLSGVHLTGDEGPPHWM